MARIEKIELRMVDLKPKVRRPGDAAGRKTLMEP